jgi:hypothetical protein
MLLFAQRPWGPALSDDLAALAADAYVYGFPLIFDLHAVGGDIKMGLLAPAPFNKLSHAGNTANDPCPGLGSHR